VNYTISEIFSYVVLIPALICLFKWRIMGPEYRPFAIYLAGCFLAEIAGTICINRWRSNIVPSTIFLIVEVLLIIWIFHSWGLFRSRRVFHFLVGACIFLFMLERIFIFPFLTFDSYVGVGFSLLIALMSISMINRLIVAEKTLLLRNPKFLACMALILFFTYDILVEVFWLYGLDKSGPFRVKVYHILVYINLISNLLYILVGIWIPRKHAYSLL